MVFKRSIDTFFVLEGHEDGARRGQVLEMVILQLVDGSIHDGHFMPLLFLDDLATLFEQVDDFSILES